MACQSNLGTNENKKSPINWGFQSKSKSPNQNQIKNSPGAGAKLIGPNQNQNGSQSKSKSPNQNQIKIVFQGQCIIDRARSNQNQNLLQSKSKSAPIKIPQSKSNQCPASELAPIISQSFLTTGL